MFNPPGNPGAQRRGRKAVLQGSPVASLSGSTLRAIGAPATPCVVGIKGALSRRFLLLLIRLLSEPMERSADWMDPARRDLEHGRHHLAAGFYDWACFSSQQVAEKAAKAALQKLGVEA